MRTGAIVAGFVALALGGCALAPEFKTFYLGHEDWRGTALSPRGRLVVSDIVAGAAPYTITQVEIGGVLGLPDNPARRIPILNQRAQTAMTELERDGIPARQIAVEVLPDRDRPRPRAGGSAARLPHDHRGPLLLRGDALTSASARAGGCGSRAAVLLSMP